MVSPGANPASPARLNDIGIDEITPLPRFERTHSATPNVMKNIEMTNKTCCQINPITFSLLILIKTFNVLK